MGWYGTQRPLNTTTAAACATTVGSRSASQRLLGPIPETSKRPPTKEATRRPDQELLQYRGCAKKGHLLGRNTGKSKSHGWSGGKSKDTNNFDASSSTGWQEPAPGASGFVPRAFTETPRRLESGQVESHTGHGSCENSVA